MFEWSNGAMRINKFLSASGYCSRREADRLIEAGRVTVDGAPAELGTVVEPGMRVRANGQELGGVEGLSGRKPVLIAVNKPVGVVCTTSDNDRAPNIVDMVEYPERIYPIGRLDKDSEGLILLTNMGELVDEILRGSNGHEKEYLVRVDKALTEGFVEHMRRGVHLNELQLTTRPCKLVIRDKTSFYITLTQGLNRQIRRMCEALGYHVVSLKRLRVMNIRLGGLKSGSWRNVTPEELKTLSGMLKKDSSARRPAPQASSGSGSASGSGTDLARRGSAAKRKGLSAVDRRRDENYKERQRAYFKRRRQDDEGSRGSGGKSGRRRG